VACPFLKEGQAHYCHAVPVRKLILEGSGMAGAGRCASPAYRECKFVIRDAAPQERCPLFEQVRVQYCSASPITKLVPVNDSQLSSCTSGGYRYCDSYLTLARPHATTPPGRSLYYAPNHFWLDAEESGLCHIGIDAFLADVAGSVDATTFVTTAGRDCPAVVLTLHGVDWPMTFPNLLLLQKVNARLRSDPARLTADPYAAGWLFEGWEVPGRTRSSLITGGHAAAWQAEERERLGRAVRDLGAPVCDGGSPVRGVARWLPRQQLVCLLQRFFASRGWAGEE